MSVEGARAEVEDAIVSLANGGVDHVVKWWAIRRGGLGGVTGQLDAALDRLILEVQAAVGCRSVNFSCCRMWPLDDDPDWLCVPCNAARELAALREALKELTNVVVA